MRPVSGVDIISPIGDITWQSARRLRDRFDRAIAARPRVVVVSLSDVDYVDSAGLATLLCANRRVRAVGGALVLVNVPQQIMRALRQARVSDVIPMRGTCPCGHDKIMTAPMGPPTSSRTLRASADPAKMGEMRRAASALIEEFDLPRDDVFDMTLALGEALGNAYDHGGRPCAQTSSEGPGMVTVTVARYPDRVTMEVTDCGEGCADFDDGDELPVPSETRGRGIRLMTMLMDGVSIRRKPDGRGTMVRLVKMTRPCHAQEDKASQPRHAQA